jgi:hypothetical protein
MKKDDITCPAKITFLQRDLLFTAARDVQEKGFIAFSA